VTALDRCPPGGRRPVSDEVWARHLRAKREAEAAAAAARRPRAPSRAARERAKDGSHAVLILPDAHHPYQDKAALSIVEQVAALVRPRRIVILGDWIDASCWSRHPARSAAEIAAHTFGAELDACGATIDRLQRASGAEEVAYVEGNHEARVEAVCLSLGHLGAAIHDLVSPRRLLQRGRPWLKWIPYSPAGDERGIPNRGPGVGHYKITPDLWAVHGWSIATHAAAKHLDIARTVSIVHGHTHRQQSVSKRLLENGRVVKAWSPGCLSELQPAWRHSSPTDWVCGFDLAFVTDDRRAWTQYTITVDRDQCVLPRGTHLSA